MKAKLTVGLVTLWATAATVLLFARPDISLALNNWIHQRETMQGHMFLMNTEGPEGFVAFGNETFISCGRPCVVEEMEGAEPSQSLCESQWEGRKHICVARFWPGRQHIVRAQRRRATDVQ